MNTDRRLLIAEFARRTRLPVSALRYYDRIGLLRPVEVDPRSGYRRYSSDQLADAVTIAKLRAIGTSPDTIAGVLAGGNARTAAIDAERRRLTYEIRDRTVALASLDQLDLSPVATPQRVELAATEVPALPFTSSAAHLSATLKRNVATLRSRLRGHHLAHARWGALLPLDLDDQVTGHVFAHLDGEAPPPDEPNLEIVGLPTGTAFRLIHNAPTTRSPTPTAACSLPSTAPPAARGARSSSTTTQPQKTRPEPRSQSSPADRGSAAPDWRPVTGPLHLGASEAASSRSSTDCHRSRLTGPTQAQRT